MSRRGRSNGSIMEPGWYPDPDRPGIEIYWDGSDFPDGVPPREASTHPVLLTRLAITVGVLLALGAIAVTLTPTSPTAAAATGCGTWLSPEFEREEVADGFGEAVEAEETLSTLGGDTTELQASMLALARIHR